MRKTRKLNKRYNKTRRSGGGNENKKVLPQLPASPLPSPPPTPPSSPNRKRVNRGVVVNVSDQKLQKDTYDYYMRAAQLKRINNIRKPKPLSYINRIMGKKSIEKVPLDEYGNPVKSYFKPNNGFKGL
jgi:hypothetical protein